MKKVFTMICALCAFVLCSCSSSGDEPAAPVEKKEVTFVLSFELDGKSMSRATNDEVYESFYKDMIASKKLIPDNYELSFKNKETGASYDFKGKWSENDMITLLEGKYTVTGICHDKKTNHFQERVSLKFEEDVELKESSTKITLKAIYDSFLIFFNKSNIKSLEYCSNVESKYMNPIEFTYKDCFYLFSRSFKDTYHLYIQGKRTNGSSFIVYTYDVPFENGKYYFFNDATSSFDIPKMEAGN